MPSTRVLRRLTLPELIDAMEPWFGEYYCYRGSEPMYRQIRSISCRLMPSKTDQFDRGSLRTPRNGISACFEYRPIYTVL